MLVGLSGSVATVKWAELVLLLRDFCEVSCPDLLQAIKASH